MAIKVGDALPPELKVKEMRNGAPTDVTTGEIFKGKRVVLFAVPGAFTPTCSMKHLPGFVADAEKIRAKAVDDVVCVSVNDVFVMDAWGKASGAQGFNIGMNQGHIAGAGIAAHLHQHVVPRWPGDQNFMPIIGRTKTLPELLSDTRDLFAKAWTD